MITASKILIDFIDGQNSKKDLGERWGCTERTIYNVRTGTYDVSADLIGKIINDTGFDFEKAFIVEGDRNEK